MRKPNVISTSNIPASVPKKQRARLLKIQQEKVRKQLKTKYFLFEPQTMEFVTPYSLELNKVGMNQAFADLMAKIEVKWLITCFILSRQKNGKNELTPFEFEVKTPCKHSEIMDHVSDFHWQQIEEFKANPLKSDNFITAGWVATEGRDVPEDVAYKLFEQVGAWSLPSDWEDEKSESI